MALLSIVIRKTAKKRGMTIKELISKISTSQTSFHENLKINSFKYSTLLEISKALDVPLSYLILESEKEIDYKQNKSNFVVEDDPANYLTTAGEKLREENKRLKKTIEDKEMIIKFLKKEK